MFSHRAFGLLHHGLITPVGFIFSKRSFGRVTDESKSAFLQNYTNLWIQQFITRDGHCQKCGTRSVSKGCVWGLLQHLAQLHKLKNPPFWSRLLCSPSCLTSWGHDSTSHQWNGAFVCYCVPKSLLIDPSLWACTTSEVEEPRKHISLKGIFCPYGSSMTSTQLVATIAHITLWTNCSCNL